MRQFKSLHGRSRNRSRGIVQVCLWSVWYKHVLNSDGIDGKRCYIPQRQKNYLFKKLPRSLMSNSISEERNVIISLFTPTTVMGRIFTVCVSVCLSVSLFFLSRYISKTDAVKITKLDTEMFHHESQKIHLFWGERSKIKVTRHNKCRRGLLHYCEYWLFLFNSAIKT